VPRPKTLLKELCEPRDNKRNVISQFFEKLRNLHLSCSSILKGYVRSVFSVHANFSAALNSRPIGDFRAVIPGAELGFDRGSFGCKSGASALSDGNRRQDDPSMLIDTCQFIKDGEWIGSRGRIMKRLQPLDFLRRLWGYPIKTTTFNGLFKCVGRCADGKHILLSGSIFRSANQFPDQVVQRSSEIIKAVPNNKRNLWWDRFGLPKQNTKPLAARMMFRLSTQLVRFAFEIAPSFGPERSEVMLCPADFRVNRVQGSHDATEVTTRISS